MENVSEINTTEMETAVTELAPVEEAKETTEVTLVNDDSKSLAKDLGEMAVVGLVIYAFCKLVDFIIDKVKLGIKKFKENRAAKKAQAQATQQAPAQGAPVAQVAAPVATEKKEEAQAPQA